MIVMVLLMKMLQQVTVMATGTMSLKVTVQMTMLRFILAPQKSIMMVLTRTVMECLTLIKMAMAQILPTSAEQIAMTSIQVWKHWT